MLNESLFMESPKQDLSPAQHASFLTIYLCSWTAGKHLSLCAAGQVVSTGPQDPTLDKFFAQHNSEDNASFQELLKASQDRLRKAKPWLFKNHNPSKEGQLLLTDAQTDVIQQPPAAIAAPPGGSDAAQQSTTSGAAASSQAEPSGALAAQQTSTSSGVIVVHDSDASTSIRDADKVVRRSSVQTDGFGTTGQESQTLVSWPHTNKSALYYDSSQRDVVPYTETELADMVQGPPKRIKHSSTRFPSDFDASQQSAKVIFTFQFMLNQKGKRCCNVAGGCGDGTMEAL